MPSIVGACFLPAVFLAAIVASPTLSGAQELPGAVSNPPLNPAVREAVTQVPVRFTMPGGEEVSGDMVLTTTRPAGNGPFPAVVMSHGRDPKKREEARRFNYPRLVDYWTRRGFAVFIPTRLGYGDSGTKIDPESANGCDRADYRRPLTAISKQISATVAFARSQPGIDPSRIVLMGQSYGGIGTIEAAAEQLEGVIGAINFAGGLGGRPEGNPGNPCAAEQVEHLIAEAGQKSRLPELWLYAQNDKYWGMIWPNRWHAAFQARGGNAVLVISPPVGEEGHYLLSQGFDRWRPRLDKFLTQLGFTPPHVVDAPASTGFAAIVDEAAVPFLTPAARTDGYRKFIAADVPRAFAVSPLGAWGWASGENAVDRALDNCRAHTKATCRLYAVDDAVVWPRPPQGPAQQSGVSSTTTGAGVILPQPTPKP